VFDTARGGIFTDLMDGDLAGQHLGTLALGIRNVLCTPLRVVRYLDQSDGAGEQRPTACFDSAKGPRCRHGAQSVGRGCRRGRVGDRKRGLSRERKARLTVSCSAAETSAA
jgi:hypothetical protein